MRRTRLPATLIGVLVLAVAALLAGCSSDSSEGPLTKTEYESAMVDSFAAIEASEEEIAAPEGASRSVQATAIEDTADLFDTLAADLETLEPPTEIAEEHQGFVEVVYGIGDEYREFADRLRAGEVPSIKEYLKNSEPLLSPSPELLAKSNAFREAAAEGGYDFGEAITLP